MTMTPEEFNSPEARAEREAKWLENKKRVLAEREQNVKHIG